MQQTGGSAMAHRPILRPDDSESSPLSAASRGGQTEDETVYPLNELANTFVAQGAGIISADLALDLVLNDIVKQACLATGASGAAVALLRDGEMVCRASSGAAAPDLGIRLDTRSGLAGAAVQSGELQLCPNTGSDPRVDARTCRRCGILSILVLPLMEEGEVFGIFEVLSPQLNAFGELDVLTIKALAQQIVQNRRQAHETTGKLEMGLIQPEIALAADPMSEEPSAGSGVGPESPDIPADGQAKGAARVKQRRSRQTDFWTGFLAVAVIGTAVLMALLIGWRLGWTRAAARHRRESAGSRTEKTKTAAAKLEAPAVEPPASSPATVPDTPAATNVPSRPAVHVQAKAPAAPPVGGLVVYEKGKVIFRMPPSSPEKALASQEGRINQQDVVLAAGITPDPQNLDEKSASERLVHRVAPKYPAEALREHTEGAVVLKAEIGRDGEVQKLTVLQGDPVLSGAALQAVKQWRYRPYLMNGKPVQMQTTITVNFNLPAE